MDSYSSVRCLFCETGKEKRVVDAIHEKQMGRAIFAQRVKIIWKDHKYNEETYPLLPGYVFVYVGKEDILSASYQEIPHVIRVLTYENGMDKLRGRDLEFAEWLWQLDGKIGVMKAMKVGKRIEIIDTLFKELNGSIIKMNRRQKSIRVSLNTEGTPMQILLSYEVVESINEYLDRNR